MRLLILGFIFVTIAGFGCREKTIEPTEGENVLSAEDVGVTDAWLKIHLPHSPLQSEITLKRDTTTIFKTTLTSQDTLVSDTGLLPNHTYIYKLIQDFGYGIKPETQLAVTTMDTTSHDFTWTIDTLGDGNTSILYDVAIINDTLAYAVGEISVKDSLGNWINPPCNLAKWNGKQWKLSTVLYNGGYAPTKFIFALSDNDIWLGMGYLVHWNGERYISIEVPPFLGVNPIKMWCSQNSLMYIVGNNGTIAYSSNNGTQWEKIESGTSTDITDVWGIVNPTTNNVEVYCAVTSFWTPQDKKILKISNTGSVDTVKWGTGRDIVSVWTKKGFPMFTAGDGVFENRFGFAWREMNIGASIYTNRIRGIGINDIFVAGDFGMISHYNGINFKLVQFDFSGMSGYSGLAMNDHLIIAVGSDASRAIIAIGKR